MAFTSKPTFIPEWATDDVYNAETETYNVATPNAAKIELGWDAYEKPPRNYMNWLQRGNYQWIEYFEQFYEDDHTFVINEIVAEGASGVNIEGVIILDGTATGALTGNATTANGINETGTASGVVHTKIIEIGNWNMRFSSGGSVSKSVAHGLSDISKIRGVSVIVRDDAGSPYYKLERYVSDKQQGGVYEINSTNVELYILAGGSYDTAYFDSTSYNRGWIMIQYID